MLLLELGYPSIPALGHWYPGFLGLQTGVGIYTFGPWLLGFWTQIETYTIGSADSQALGFELELYHLPFLGLWLSDSRYWGLWTP